MKSFLKIVLAVDVAIILYGLAGNLALQGKAGSIPKALAKDVANGYGV